MPTPLVVLVAGASGAGKTATVRALEARAVPGLSCHYFDAIGVPSPEEMVERYGSGEAWQAAMMDRWVERLLASSSTIAVLDGQVRPTFAAHSFRRAGISGLIILLDASSDVRAARLRGPRGQPELHNDRMNSWAAYLRGQADALRLTVIDTSSVGVDHVADQVLNRIRVEAAG